MAHEARDGLHAAALDAAPYATGDARALRTLCRGVDGLHLGDEPAVAPEQFGGLALGRGLDRRLARLAGFVEGLVGELHAASLAGGVPPEFARGLAPSFFLSPFFSSRLSSPSVWVTRMISSRLV